MIDNAVLHHIMETSLWFPSRFRNFEQKSAEFIYFCPPQDQLHEQLVALKQQAEPSAEASQELEKLSKENAELQQNLKVGIWK